jgi:hypothetical protein
VAGSIRHILDNALFAPDYRLIKAIEKKLTPLEIDLLRIWLENERDFARLEEWNKQKHRIIQ